MSQNVTLQTSVFLQTLSFRIIRRVEIHCINNVGITNFHKSIFSSQHFFHIKYTSNMAARYDNDVIYNYIKILQYVNL